MNEKLMVISCDGYPLVIITTHTYELPSTVLEAYGKRFGFSMSRLSYSFVETLTSQDIFDVSRKEKSIYGNG